MSYRIIYADPPWQYSDKGCNGAAEKQYPTLTLDDIASLPVSVLADDDACLFLWATNPLLPEALTVLDAWGFKYKSVAFTWVKHYPKATNKRFYGLGRWTRGNVENVLLGTKGKPQRIAKDVFSLIETMSDVIEAPVTRHSAKPPEVRERIVRLCGDVPRVELFARDLVPGWEAIGNDLDGLDIRDSVRYLIEAAA